MWEFDEFDEFDEYDTSEKEKYYKETNGLEGLDDWRDIPIIDEFEEPFDKFYQEYIKSPKSPKSPKSSELKKCEKNKEKEENKEESKEETVSKTNGEPVYHDTTLNTMLCNYFGITPEMFLMVEMFSAYVPPKGYEEQYRQLIMDIVRFIPMMKELDDGFVGSITINLLSYVPPVGLEDFYLQLIIDALSSAAFLVEGNDEMLDYLKKIINAFQCAQYWLNSTDGRVNFQGNGFQK